jgi:hypothetical protein
MVAASTPLTVNTEGAGPDYVLGLVADLERKNGWTLAEHAGEVSPDGMQRLLRRADWDIDEARNDVRGYAIENPDDRGRRAGRQ